MNAKKKSFILVSLSLTILLLLSTINLSACTYTISLSTSYSGLNWNNDSYISVHVNGVTVINSLTKPYWGNGVDSSFFVSTGDTISITYSPTTYRSDWDYYEVKNAMGMVVARSGENNTTPTDISELIASCPINIDAGVVDIFTTHSNAGQPATIKAVIGNYGYNTITNMDVNWSLNGIGQPPVNYTSSLSSAQLDTVTLGIYNFSQGPQNISATTAYPNGLFDSCLLNNEHSKTLGFYGIVTTFPYSLGFESDSLEDWKNVLYDDFYWGVNSGPTPSTLTGPQSASEGSYYIFCEGSPALSNDIYVVESSYFDFTGKPSPIFSFDYHMDFNGYTSGNLKLQATCDDVSWTTLWEKTGHQNNNWNSTAISLTAYADSLVKFRFYMEMTSGNTAPRNDAAIDNIKIFQPTLIDLKATSIIEPFKGIEMDSTVKVELEILNNGVDSVSGYTVGFSGNGGNYISESSNIIIAPDSSHRHKFLAKADLSLKGNNILKAFVSNPGDTAFANDTISANIENFKLPYFQDFEVAGSYASTGWSSIDFPNVVIVSLQSFASQHSIDIRAFNNVSSIAVMPPYYGDFSNTRLKFKATSTDSTEQLVVGVLTVPDDYSTFVAIDTFNIVGQNNFYWQKFTLDFFSYSGKANYIAFKIIDPNGVYYRNVKLDDVELLYMADNDISVVDIIDPHTGILLDSSQRVTIRIKNTGVLTQSSIPVKLSIDGGNSFVWDTVPGPIQTDEIITHTFNTTVDLSTDSIYNIFAVSALVGDQKNLNDTAYKTIRNNSLPLFENFDTLTVPFGFNLKIPNGWSLINYSNANDDVCVKEWLDYSPPNALHLLHLDTNNSQLFATMPPYYGAFTFLHLDFMIAKTNHLNSHLIVGILNDPLNPFTFTPLDTFTLNSDYTYYSKTIDLSNYSGNGNYIAFKHLCDERGAFTIDDVHLYNNYDHDIHLTGLNEPVSGIQFSDSMLIEVSVKNKGKVDADSIPIKYSLDGGLTYFNDTIYGHVNSGATVLHTFSSTADLSAFGSHEIIFRTELGIDQNPNNDSSIFFVDNYPYPYNENFDADTIDKLPSSYSSINATNNGYVRRSQKKCFSQPSSMRINNFNASDGQDLFAILPAFYGSLDSSWLKYKLYNRALTDSIIVGVLDNPTDPYTFTGIDTITFSNEYHWDYYITSFSSYTGSGKYIAFKHTCTLNHSNIFIDDIILEPIPAGPIVVKSKDTLKFSKVRYNAPDTSSMYITIMNDGIGLLNITGITINGSDSVNFSIMDTNSYPISLSTTEDKTFLVNFFGSVVGAKSATLNFTTNIGTYKVILKGNVWNTLIDSFPYVENMDNNGLMPLAWHQTSSGNYTWDFGTSTPTPFTGAMSDHSGNGFFAYAEATNSMEGDSAFLYSPQIDFSSIGNPKMTFWYFMYGFWINKLYIDIASNGNWIHAIDSISGQQQSSHLDSWKIKEVDLSPYFNIDSIRFVAVRGTNEYGDIAIDDIAFGTNLHIDIAADTVICEGNSIIFDAGFGSQRSYQWFVDSMSMDAVIANTPSITVDSAGMYYVKVTGIGGFTGIDSVLLSVNPNPDIDFGADTLFICATDTAELYPGSFDAYSWSTGHTSDSILVDSAGNNNGHKVIALTVFDSLGCMNTDSIVIVFVDHPTLSINGPDTMMMSSSASFDAGPGFHSYLWSTNDTSQVIILDSNGVHAGMNSISVTVTNNYGCSSSATKDVYIVDDTGIESKNVNFDICLYPNPNNGLFRLDIKGVKQALNMEIINVNGQLIRRAYIKKNMFNKEYDLRELPKGVYYVRFYNENITYTSKLIIQ